MIIRKLWRLLCVFANCEARYRRKGVGKQLLIQAFPVQIENLHVSNGFSVDDKTYHGDFLMKTAIARCPGINMEQIQLAVVNDFQDMRMTANEQIGLMFLQQILDFRQIMPRIAADMGHIYLHVFHLEKQIFRISHPDDMVVNVAMNGTQRLEMCQSFGGSDVADIVDMARTQESRQLLDAFRGYSDRKSVV